MASLFKEHDLEMNIDDDVLETVLNSWFKNTFETGLSGGYLAAAQPQEKLVNFTNG